MLKPKLFSNEIEPACAYCRRGKQTVDKLAILCPQYGVCAPYDHCKRFVYAPLKRIPKRPRAMLTCDPSDFEL